jgi:ribosomal protein S18 acetylase RimI-like enzyme
MEGPDIVVRRLGAGDEQFVASAVRYWGSEPDGDAPVAFLSDPTVIAVGAFADRELIGFAYGYVQTRPDGRAMAQLYSLDVWPAFRRMGVGAEIVQTFRRAAGDVSKVWIMTATDNDAGNALYQALGGERQNVAENVYYWHSSPRSRLHH